MLCWQGPWLRAGTLSPEITPSNDIHKRRLLRPLCSLLAVSISSVRFPKPHMENLSRTRALSVWCVCVCGYTGVPINSSLTQSSLGGADGTPSHLSAGPLQSVEKEPFPWDT